MFKQFRYALVKGNMQLSGKYSFDSFQILFGFYVLSAVLPGFICICEAPIKVIHIEGHKK